MGEGGSAASATQQVGPPLCSSLSWCSGGALKQPRHVSRSKTLQQSCLAQASLGRRLGSAGTSARSCNYGCDMDLNPRGGCMTPRGVYAGTLRHGARCPGCWSTVQKSCPLSRTPQRVLLQPTRAFRQARDLQGCL